MSAVPRQAMVLAAGLGKRMRPLTDHKPKPLIEVAGRSLIDRAIDRLEEAGVEKIVVNTSYLAPMLEEHLSKRRGAQIVFSREEEPLEVGGGIARAVHHFGNEPFFAVNGDIIWLDGEEPALLRLARRWDAALDALLLLHPVATSTGYEGRGDFNFTSEGALACRLPDATAPYVYAGVQLLHPRLFKDSPSGVFFLNLLYDRSLAAQPQRIAAIIHDGAWLHVGDPEGLRMAEAVITIR